MRRIGKFTGKLYDADYDFSQCPECCVVITDEEANNEESIQELHAKALLGCLTCMGCPSAMRTVVR